MFLCFVGARRHIFRVLLCFSCVLSMQLCVCLLIVLLVGRRCVTFLAPVCFLVTPVAPVDSEVAYFNASRTTYGISVQLVHMQYVAFLCNSGCLKITSKNPPCQLDDHLNHSSHAHPTRYILSAVSLVPKIVELPVLSWGLHPYSSSFRNCASDPGPTPPKFSRLPCAPSFEAD